MTILSRTVFGALAATLIATPILAQQRDRPSRDCVREIVQLCGRDRSQIRECLREKHTQLSDKCSAEVRERMEQRRGENRAARAPQPVAKVDATVIYGQDRRQQVDIFAAKDGPQTDRWTTLPPLILFIHGGGWSFGNHKTTIQHKPAHFTSAGYAFASAGYRLMPNAPVEEQARDIGRAIGAVRAQAEDIGFDRDRIVLMGHSAGAHLAALVSTDPQYAGDTFGSIKGAVLLDGAGYEITSSMANAEPRAQDLYQNVFGDDPARHVALSPVTHAGGPDAPHWLILYVEDRERSRAQSLLLAEKLTAVGAQAEAVAIANTDHGRMNREIGIDAGSAQTGAIDAFLGRVFRS